MVLEGGAAAANNNAPREDDLRPALPASPWLDLTGGEILYEDNPRPLTPDMLGELCVCWLADGRVVAKRPFPGDIPGRFDLYAFGSVALIDCEIVQAAFVCEVQTSAYTRRRNAASPMPVDKRRSFLDAPDRLAG